MSRKKRLIIIFGSVLVGVIALIILLSFTLFSLRKIEVDFRTSTLNLDVTQEKIIENSGIGRGGSIFFRNKNKYIKKLEDKYPYIKVINIESVFPSKYIIHVGEREEVYAVEHNDIIHICDDQFKILRILSTEEGFNSSQQNSIKLSGVKIEDKNYAVGEKLNVSNFVDIYSVLHSHNRTIAEQKSIIKEITFSIERDETLKKDVLNATLKLFDGQEYKIINCNYGLKYKIKLFLDVFSQIFTYIGKNLILEDESEIPITEDLLLNSTVVINNYYDYTSHSEKDCYFNIIPKYNNN